MHVNYKITCGLQKIGIVTLLEPRVDYMYFLLKCGVLWKYTQSESETVEYM